MTTLSDICLEEFQLVYFGHFSYSELDEMSVHEREMIYGMLINQKNEEKEQYEKALQGSD